MDLLLENFGARGALRLLAENLANLDFDVSWDYAPLVEAGWAEREEFWPGAAPDQQFLIVTEGSSDAKILQKALQLLRPHIADFFRFVDMEEGYPFAGTGNLYFTQGWPASASSTIWPTQAQLPAAARSVAPGGLRLVWGEATVHRQSAYCLRQGEQSPRR